MSILLRTRQSVWSSLRFAATFAGFDEIFKIIVKHFCRTINKISAVTTRNYCAPKDTTVKRDTAGPVKFAGSPASAWVARKARQGSVPYEDVPWFQTYVVCGSVAIFLIYFCILREENDMDLEMEKSLYDRVPGLEKTQLVINYKYNLEHQVDNKAIVARMKEMGMNPDDIQL